MYLYGEGMCVCCTHRSFGLCHSVHLLLVISVQSVCFNTFCALLCCGLNLTSDIENVQRFNGLRSILNLLSQPVSDAVLEHVVFSLAWLLKHKM